MIFRYRSGKLETGRGYFLDQSDRFMDRLGYTLDELVLLRPTDIAFLPEVGEGGISYNFRQLVLMAWEGMHLKQRGTRDIEVVFIE